MKRKIAFLLALVMSLCVGFAACGGEDEQHNGAESTTTIAPTTTQTPMVEVPRLVGKMYYAEVEDNMEYDHNFNLNIEWGIADDPSYEKGRVFQQSLTPGDVVPQGTGLTVHVNGIVLDTDAMGVDDFNVAGMSKDTVRRWLEEAGFAVYESYQHCGDHPPHCVVSIDIEIGKVYPVGTRVTMLISRGP